MYFAGRAQETRRIIKALERGESVIISGRFGMGRTALARHIADMSGSRWRFVFVDFSKTPAVICRHLARELFPAHTARQDAAYIHYKPARFAVLNRAPEDPHQHVLVLDNIEKITPQKAELLYMLTAEKRFLFIAITESWLPENQYHQLKVALLATCTVTLGHLGPASSRSFFSHFSKKYGFHWSDEHINSLRQQAAGYPLSMKEIINAELHTRGR